MCNWAEQCLPAINKEIVLYFFSASAQVWAALTTLGGFFIRDRSVRYENQMNEHCHSVWEHLKPIRRWLAEGNNIQDYTPDLFISRSTLEQVFGKNSVSEIRKRIRATTEFHSSIAGHAQETGFGSSLDDQKEYVEERIEDGRRYFDYYLDRLSKRNKIDKVLPKVFWYGGALILISLLGVGFQEVICVWGIFWPLAILLLLFSCFTFQKIANGFKDDETQRLNR